MKPEGDRAMANHGSRRSDVIRDPDDLILVTDPSHHLYDERVLLEPDDGLVRSIMDVGVLQAVAVQGDGDKKTMVVFGRQRVKAAREANRRFKEQGSPRKVFVPTRPIKGSNTRMMQILGIENEARVQDNVYAKAVKAQRMLDFGSSEEEILGAFCVTSWQTVAGYLKILELDEALQKAVRRGDLSATQALHFHGLERKEQVAQYEAWKMRQEMSPEDKKAERKARKAQRDASGPRAPQKKKVRKVIEGLGEAESGIKKAVKVALQWVVGDLTIEEVIAQIEEFPSV